MKNSQCVLGGYFGFGNAGDEMIWECLYQNAPDITWRILHGKPAKDKNSHCGGAGSVIKPHNSQFINRWNPIGIVRAMIQSCSFVLGGGELFQTQTSLLSFLYYCTLPVLAKLCGCAVFFHAMGMDSHLSVLQKKALRFVLKSAQSISVRDQKSGAVLDSIGMAGLYRVVPDPVWSCPVAQTVRPVMQKRLLWILRFSGIEDASVQKWQKALNQLSETTHHTHGFIVLHPWHDDRPLACLCQGLRFFHTIEKWRTSTDMIKVIQKYDTVISMRYHGLVLAGLCRRACLAVPAHQKVAHLADSLLIPALSVNELSGLALRHGLDSAWHAFGTAQAPDIHIRQSHASNAVRQLVENIKAIDGL